MKIDNICVQGAYEPKCGDSRVLPLHQSTTYYYESCEQLADLFDLKTNGHIYSRISNPTVDCFEKKMALLEGGVGALACSSGLAAETLAIMNVAGAGDNILSASVIYGGSYNLFNVTLRKFGIDTRFFDVDAAADEIERLIDGKTKIIYCETVANPAITVADLDKLVAIGKKHGIIVMVDNTLATPYLCNPFKFGVNVIIHSTTKYLDGHASAVGGVIIDGGNFKYQDNPRYTDLFTPDESYHGMIYTRDCGAAAYIMKARVQLMRDFGCCMSPFNAFITNLGTETLHLRMARHSANGIAAAKFLKNHEAVEWVRYNGLDSDPNKEKSDKYYNGCGYGGMVVFGVKGGRKNAQAVLDNLKNISIVTHIADTRSCILHPASTTHRQLSDSDLKSAGITDNLVRLSVGIEDEDFIISDLKQSLDKVVKG